MNISTATQFFSGDSFLLNRLSDSRPSLEFLASKFSHQNARFVLSLYGSSSLLFSKTSAFPSLFFASHTSLSSIGLANNPFLPPAPHGRSSFHPKTPQRTVQEYQSVINPKHQASYVFLGEISHDPSSLKPSPESFYLWAIDLGNLASYSQSELCALASNPQQNQTPESCQTSIETAFDAEFLPFRQGALQLNTTQSQISALARSLIDWNYRNQFCPSCGNKNWSAQGGYKRLCVSGFEQNDNTLSFPENPEFTCPSQKSLNNFAFPRTDPVVIVAITSPCNTKILLARKSIFPKNRYSCIAGFVDAAESIEEAVRREALEETGIKVDQVEYFTSQPWPFPNSLMIGCFARATTTEITIDGNELEDAKWFTAKDVLPAVIKSESETNLQFIKSDHLLSKNTSSDDSLSEILLPPPIAVGFFLTQAWCHRQAELGKL
ncbi:hypothetical protein BB558_003505 [Smittium angustum]|uniref:NAD(+) diphosphatase n=1 Tax=Smittium angustum TaxID=133377 RepID=A0A2U1J5Y8_SMIAN|nr:hypothetical protein BB558_003505 [Smittium angustum]